MFFCIFLSFMRSQTIYQIAIRPRREKKKKKKFNLTFVTMSNKETKEKESTLPTQTALGETGRVMAAKLLASFQT